MADWSTENKENEAMKTRKPKRESKKRKKQKKKEKKKEKKRIKEKGIGGKKKQKNKKKRVLDRIGRAWDEKKAGL